MGRRKSSEIRQMQATDLTRLESRVNAVLAEYRRTCDELRALEAEHAAVLEANRELKARIKGVLDRVRALELETA